MKEEGRRRGCPGQAAAVPLADHTRPPFSTRSALFQRRRRGEGPEAVFCRPSTHPLPCAGSHDALPCCYLATHQQKQARGAARSTLEDPPPHASHEASANEKPATVRCRVTNTHALGEGPAQARGGPSRAGRWQARGAGGARPVPARAAAPACGLRAVLPRGKGPATSDASTLVEGVRKETSAQAAGCSECPDPSPGGRVRTCARGARLTICYLRRLSYGKQFTGGAVLEGPGWSQ